MSTMAITTGMTMLAPAVTSLSTVLARVAPPNQTGKPIRKYPAARSTNATSSDFLKPTWSAMVPDRMGRK